MSDSLGALTSERGCLPLKAVDLDLSRRATTPARPSIKGART
jgi:hypothetical protein